MPFDVEIKYVTKADGSGPQKYITHVGGVRPDGKAWTLTEVEVIQSIEKGHAFHIMVGHKSIPVMVASRKTCKYLKTVLDREGPDRLLALPERPYNECVALKALGASADHSPESQRQMVLLFMGTAEQCLGRMQGLVVRGDSREWQSALQELELASSDIHATEFAALCKHAVDVADGAVSKMSAYLKIKEAYEGLLIDFRTANLLMNPGQGG